MAALQAQSRPLGLPVVVAGAHQQALSLLRDAQVDADLRQLPEGWGEQTWWS